MSVRRPTRAQRVGTAAVSGGVLLAVFNWVAFFIGLPGNVEAWRSLAVTLGGVEIEVPPYWLGVYVAELLLIVGVFCLSSSLWRWYAAGFGRLRDVVGRRRRRERIRENLRPLWPHCHKALEKLSDGPAEINVGRDENTLRELGIIEIRSAKVTRRIHGLRSPQMLCALTPEALPVVRDFAGKPRRCMRWLRRQQ